MDPPLTRAQQNKLKIEEESKTGSKTPPKKEPDTKVSIKLSTTPEGGKGGAKKKRKELNVQIPSHN
jgi:hypothetical protein